MSTSAQSTPTSDRDRDLYEVLGVARTATADEISAAYKALAKRHHPDRHSTKSSAAQSEHAEIFKAASDAYSVLGDAEKRRSYDMFGHSGGRAGGASMDDAAAQAMFEAMFMNAGGHQSAAPTRRRVVGGALFVDATRGQFFQRSWSADDAEKMVDEMKQGLPEMAGSGGVTTTAMPHGAWEVRLVEVDEGTRTVTVTLCADDDKEADDGAAPPLRLERVFALPAEADVNEVDVTLDEASGVLSVTTSKGALPPARGGVDVPSSDVSTSGVPDAASPVADEPVPMFVVGEEPTAPAPPKSSRSAARRRAKHEGLKAGFLNSAKTQRAGKAPPAACKENVEPVDEAVAPMPRVERVCSSPVSVCDDVDEAMHAQVDALMQGA